MQDIYVYGCGGVGRELCDCFLSSDKYRMRGFIDDNTGIRECMGFQCRTLNEMITERNMKEIRVIISIGEPFIRRRVSEKLAKVGIDELTVDFSEHFNPNYSLVGVGTLLHSNSYISVNSCIGKSCFINKDALVGHDCKIGDYSVLSPRVTLGGNVSVGENSYIGTGALIRNGITIGKNVIVGMGAVVVNNIDDDCVVVGNPARFLRKNESHRVFKR